MNVVVYTTPTCPYCRNAQDLEQALDGLTTGHRVLLVFLRGPETLKAEVVL